MVDEADKDDVDGSSDEDCSVVVEDLADSAEGATARIPCNDEVHTEGTIAGFTDGLSSVSDSETDSILSNLRNMMELSTCMN